MCWTITGHGKALLFSIAPAPKGQQERQSMVWERRDRKGGDEKELVQWEEKERGRKAGQ